MIGSKTCAELIAPTIEYYAGLILPLINVVCASCVVSVWFMCYASSDFPAVFLGVYFTGRMCLLEGGILDAVDVNMSRLAYHCITHMACNLSFSSHSAL